MAASRQYFKTMKKIFILSFFIVNLASGQSVSITPASTSHLSVYKKTGTAQLTIQGDGDAGVFPNPGTNGHTKINMINNTYIGSNASNSINFLSNSYGATEIFSIKHTYEPNFGGQENTFYINYFGVPIFSFEAGRVKTVNHNIKDNTNDLLQLENTNALGSNVTSDLYFKTGNYFTGSIKTIGATSNLARMGFFTSAGTFSTDLLERMSIRDDGNVGIGQISPNAPLQFSNALGNRKLVIYEAANNDHQFYGIGLNSSVFRYQVDGTSSNHIFYAATSASASSELMRITGLGKVGIGVSLPDQLLDVNGRARIRHLPGFTAGVWMSNSLNSTNGADGAFYGMKTDTEAGIYIGNNWRFWVNNAGNLTVGGTVTASCGVLVCSDLRYKRNITSLNNSLENILKINGVRYNFKKDEFPERNFSDKNQIGFIAQEIEKIFPEMVFTDEKGYKSVDYARLTPVLVEAMKELKMMNDEFRMKNEKLEANNQKLESRLDKIEAMLQK